jgi:hypothetical protein
MPIRAVLLAGLILIGASPAAWSQQPRTSQALGDALTSCQTWTQERQAQSARAGAMAAWILGFVSAANAYAISSSPDLLTKATPLGIVSWIDDYCRIRPLAKIAFVADLLVKELRLQAGRLNQP